ncbi:MAG: hypothetical protein HY699_02265 [Deltaproteobacteria bacterium]|nr:hypothetical protein [Deltaproteobacteria bacterium]
MSLARRITAMFVVILLAGCGESGTNPLRAREANFRVKGVTGTPFRLVEILASNGPPHLFDPPRELLAPHTFILLNAGPNTTDTPGLPPDPQVRATFSGNPTATNDVTIELRLGFEENLVAPPAVIAAGTEQEVSVATNGPQPALDASAPEIRLEVCTQTNPPSTLCSEQTGSQNEIPFTANIGDETSTFLPCGDTRLCTAPTMFYFEAPQRTVSAIISKAVRDDQVILANLYLNGTFRSAARATRDEPNARVRVDL